MPTAHRRAATSTPRCPPIFGIKVRKKIYYVYPNGKEPEEDILRRKIRELGFDYDSDEEVEDSTNGKVKKKKRPYTVQRYKGLGEMDPKQLCRHHHGARVPASLQQRDHRRRRRRRARGARADGRPGGVPHASTSSSHAHDARFLDA